MKRVLKSTITSLVAVQLTVAAFSLRAADKKEASPATSKSAEAAAKATPGIPAKVRPLPYGGTVAAVDKTTVTITIKKKAAQKTFSITSATRIVKMGKPATLEDVVIGEEAGISYVEAEGGKTEAKSLRLGPKPEKQASESKEKAEKPAKDAKKAKTEAETKKSAEK